MKALARSCALTIYILFVFGTHARSQSQFEVTIRQFPAEELIGYIQPLGDMFGANLNAGMFHSAAIPEDGFHFRIDVIAMASLVQDKDRMYEAGLPSGFVPQGGSTRTATIFGGRGTTFRDVNSGLEYKGTDGLLNMNYFPLFVPQITIGTILGTQASVRYISTPSLSSNKLPPTRLFGAGIRHSISRYITDSPIDMSIGGFYSVFSVGDILEFTGTTVNLQLSKSFSLLTLYSGTAWEHSDMQAHYSYRATENAAPTPVNVALTGGNTFRVTTGLMIDLQAIRLFADANFGTVQHFSGGIGFGF
jgi:hypothetical protein